MSDDRPDIQTIHIPRTLLSGCSCIVRVSFRDSCAVVSIEELVRGRDVYFARLAIPRWPANGTRLHTHRSPGNFQRKRRSVCDSATSFCPPQCRSDNSPPPTPPAATDSVAWKTFKDCKRRCGTKTRICIRNMVGAAPVAGSTGEPPQYTALVDCRRRWEVRLGAGALDPRLIPADQSQPATAPSEQAEKAVHWHYCTRHWASPSFVSGSPALIRHCMLAAASCRPNR